MLWPMGARIGAPLSGVDALVSPVRGFAHFCGSIVCFPGLLEVGAMLKCAPGWQLIARNEFCLEFSSVNHRNSAKQLPNFLFLGA